MKTVEEIAQWVIENRFPKDENNNVTDHEMYHFLIENMKKLCGDDTKNHVCPDGIIGEIVETDYGRQCSHCMECF